MRKYLRNDCNKKPEFVVVLLSLLLMASVGAASAGQGTIGFSKQFVKIRPVKIRPIKFGRFGPVAPIGPVNVRTFGAVGNGVVDDTAAIQSAITYAASTSRVVVFPPGVYLHAGLISVTGVSISGAGPSTTALIAAHPDYCSIVLTGSGASLQHITVSTSNMPPGSTDAPYNSNVLIKSAQNFVLADVVVGQGPTRSGVYIQGSNTGSVSGCTFIGNSNSWGVRVRKSVNLSISGNSVHNEFLGICIDEAATGQPFESTAIAITGNSITSSHTQASGIQSNFANSLSIERNNIVVPIADGYVPLWLNGNNNCYVAQNNISGGINSIVMGGTAVDVPQITTITQNTISNAQQSTFHITFVPFSSMSAHTLQITNNQIGESGLVGGGTLTSVFTLNPFPVNSGPFAPGLIAVTDNVYLGHVNGLAYLISAPVPLVEISGNTQTITMLPNNTYSFP